VLYRGRVQPRRRTPVLGIAIVVIGALLVAGAGYALFRVLFAPRPKIVLAQPFATVGRNAPLVLDITEHRYGVRAVKVTITQGKDEKVVLDENYDPPNPDVQVRWSPAQEKRFRLTEGAGKLHVSAQAAKFGPFKGRRASLEQDFTARLIPPRLEVLTTQHYVNQGGGDMIVYKATPPSAETGVLVGERFFRGFPVPGAKDPAVRFAIFAYPYDVAAGTQVRLRARDEAGNETLASFWIKIFPKTFRSRELDLTDDFLNKVVPEIMSQTPSLTDQGDLLKNFLAINRDLRKQNNQALREMSAKSKEQFLWTEPFRQLSNSQVEAQFADHRIYKYQGKEVDRQDHLGYDLATNANNPISAANDGVVMMAEFFGIYGNTVVIDHGFGLLSLYGHMSSFAVKAGDPVKRGQTIGQSGATGLAGGDHLHFSMILQGEQVDAREWWDPHWIQDRIRAKLRQFGSEAPGASASPSAAARPAAPKRS
jgi:murein DD-endopeptidase MepM/ murein hydrolase activator NlpD